MNEVPWSDEQMRDEDLDELYKTVTSKGWKVFMDMIDDRISEQIAIACDIHEDRTKRDAACGGKILAESILDIATDVRNVKIPS